MTKMRTEGGEAEGRRQKTEESCDRRDPALPGATPGQVGVLIVGLVSIIIGQIMVYTCGRTAGSWEEGGQFEAIRRITRNCGVFQRGRCVPSFCMTDTT